MLPIPHEPARLFCVVCRHEEPPKAIAPDFKEKDIMDFFNGVFGK